MGESRDPRTRAEMAQLTPAGRADAVVTIGESEEAVKGVVRGGILCLPDSVRTDINLSQVVLRELSLITARDVPAAIRLAGRVGVEIAFGSLTQPRRESEWA